MLKRVWPGSSATAGAAFAIRFHIVVGDRDGLALAREGRNVRIARHALATDEAVNFLEDRLEGRHHVGIGQRRRLDEEELVDFAKLLGFFRLDLKGDYTHHQLESGAEHKHPATDTQTHISTITAQSSSTGR